MVTRPDAPAGRGRSLLPSPVGARGRGARRPGAEARAPARPGVPGRAARAGAGLLPGGGLRRAAAAVDALDIPPHGWVNLHFSACPPGAAPRPCSTRIWAGDEVTGATTFRIVKALDAGPTFGVMTERIRADDTAGDLLDRLAEGGAGLLVATLDGIEDGSLEARPQQPEGGVSFAPKITVDDARVDWRDPAEAVDRQVRACTPPPGAWTTWAGERVKLGPVRVDPDGPALPPGVLAVGKNEVLVGTAHRRGAPRRGQGVRQEADARRRLGTRGPGGRRRALRGRSRHAHRRVPPGSQPPTSTRSARRCPRPSAATSWGDVPTWKVPAGPKGEGLPALPAARTRTPPTPPPASPTTTCS